MFNVSLIHLVLTQSIASITLSLGTIVATKEMHQLMLNGIMRLPMEFFDTTPLGRILNRFSKDVDVTDNVLPQVLRMLITMTMAVCSIYKQ